MPTLKDKKEQFCKWCGEGINRPVNVEKVTHYLEKVGGMEVGKGIYLSILDKKFKSIELCNLCYTMMQNYRKIEGKEVYGK